MTQEISQEHLDERGAEDGDAVAVAEASLRARVPGQRAIGEFLSAHSTERPRSVWARLFGVSPIGTESEPFFAGAVGELHVGELLAQLDSDWTVLHAVPVGQEGADLDHLLVGPAGVFTVTTRNHPGLAIAVSGRSVLVDGLKRAHIRAAEHDLGRAERRLTAALGQPVVVTGLLVFVEPLSLSLRGTPKDIEVLASAELVPWLEAQPAVFDAVEVQRIARAAELPETWGHAREVDDDSGVIELDRLLRLVERSRALRQLWFGAATILVVVSATALATLAILGAIPGHLGR
ncbi:nuclease-related domain-containing protein [Parafrigoribacterium soli]|uniref:nuclease-related domain-containing protein n=1 Tax=Parafrigoribacterium soli TaxID=3144663 RepID=UPI0032ED3D6D